MNQVEQVVEHLFKMAATEELTRDTLIECHTLLNLILHGSESEEVVVGISELRNALQNQEPNWQAKWKRLLADAQKDIFDHRTDEARSKMKVVVTDVRNALR